MGFDVLQNLLVLAAAWSLCGGLGVLCFAGRMEGIEAGKRLHLYVLLGWCVAVAGSYALRLLPGAYAVSAPVVLAVAVAGLLAWKRGGPWRWTGTGGRALGVGLLAVLAGFLPYGLPSLAVPELRDVGNWGYDQRNYVLTASGLLDEGLLGTPEPGGERPAWPFGAVAADSLRQMAAWPEEPVDWKFEELQQKLGIAAAESRNFALFPRRGFSSLDAALAGVLGLDPQQAYTLSRWMLHVLLVHAGLWAAAQLGLGVPGAAAAVLLAAFWPYTSIPLLVDNRDQAGAAVALFLGAALLKMGNAPRSWRVAALLALLAGYPELFPVGLVLWIGLWRDAAGSWRSGLAGAARDWGVALAVMGPLLLPQVVGLMRQWQPGQANAVMPFPPAFAETGAVLDYLAGWKMLWPPGGWAAWAALAPSLLLAAGLAWGMRREWRTTRAGHAGSLVLLWAVGAAVLLGGRPYVAYKIGTGFWPLAVWGVLESMRQLPAAGRWRWVAGGVVALLSLPAVMLKSGLRPSGLADYSGPNLDLWEADRRGNDTLAWSRLARESRSGGRLFCGTEEKGKVRDLGFVQMLHRREGGWRPVHPEHSGLSAYPRIRPLEDEARVEVVAFQNLYNSRFQHRPEAHRVLPAAAVRDWRVFQFTSRLELDPECPAVLISWPGHGAEPAQGSLPWKPADGRISVRVVRLNHPPGVAARLAFLFTGAGGGVPVVRLSRGASGPKPLVLRPHVRGWVATAAVDQPVQWLEFQVEGSGDWQLEEALLEEPETSGR